MDNDAVIVPVGSLKLDSGAELAHVELNVETYGTLNSAGDNAVLVCHSLTKGAHAAGPARGDNPAGWWDTVIGPGKVLDIDRDFVICADTLGAGRSTSPASADPSTGRPYGLRFPVFTVRDVARALHQLLDALGIARLDLAIGGCYGGQQVLELAILDPEAVANAVVIATTPVTSAHSIAVFSVMRQLIRADPAWNGGDYYGGPGPEHGTRHAIMAALPLWMSRAAMEARFGRRLHGAGVNFTLEPEFEVERFIDDVGRRARGRLDPNSLLYLTRAVEYFDLAAEHGDVETAMKHISARTLFVSYDNDWRYPSDEVDALHQAITSAGGDSRHTVLGGPLGHGGFLFETGQLAEAISTFRQSVPRRPAPAPAPTASADDHRWVVDARCRHCDGIAIGTTMSSLYDAGILDTIRAGGRHGLDDLVREHRAKPGYLGVGLRLLADQGWARLDDDGDSATVEATMDGKVAFAHAGVYRRSSDLLRLASKILLTPTGAAGAGLESSLAEAVEAMAAEWELPSTLRPLHVRHQILRHLDGQLVGPALVALTRAGVLPADGGPVILPVGADQARLVELLLRPLRLEGWVGGERGAPALTQAGLLAVRGARQYWYPLSYLPTFLRVPAMLFERPGRVCSEGGVGESHLDRALDLDFSGEVFTATCEQQLLDVVLPLFERLPVDEQPAAIVDTGCGDGRLLASVCSNVAARTARGAHLARFPLLAVGVEPSPVGRAMTADRLQKMGIAHLVIDGDIGDPRGLISALDRLGVSPERALHVSKSVFHDRRVGPQTDDGKDLDAPAWRGAYAGPDGQRISPIAVARDLRNVLRQWRDVLGPAGMVVVEAHAIDPSITAGRVGRSVHTAVDATHGYSNQYPVEADTFAWAARTAGLRSCAHREPAGRSLGACTMTIDHFVADPAT